MKKKIMILFLALCMMTLTACGALDAAPTVNSTPGRMVTKLDVTVNPANADKDRSYSEQEQIAAILRMLQDMDTTEFPKESPTINEDKEYCTFTVTYANGDSRSYILLKKQYLSCDDEPWCIVDSAKAIELTKYIQNTPSN